MIVSINQPAYLPWLGYFERIDASDRHVILDHVQLEKNSFTNRNKVPTPDGWCWLTVPVCTKGRFGDLAICSVRIDNTTNWRAKHWKTLQAAYAKAPFFGAHAAAFEAIYAREWLFLEPLCREINGYLLQALGIATPLQHSSAMDPQGARDDMLLDLCRKTGAETYLSGALGRTYLREDLFARAGIRVIYQDYAHPVYPQGGRGQFLPGLAAIDLLFHCGPASLEILRQGRRFAPGAGGEMANA